MSTTFLIDPKVAFSAEELEPDAPFVYTRWGNPTVRQLEDKLARLEGATACICFASGMAAIAALFVDALRPGDHLIMSDVAYAGASELVNSIVPRGGVEVTRVDLSDLDELRAALRPATKLVYVETPANPILRLTDIAAVAEVAHAAGAKLAVDSTFATPVATRPLDLGADFVLHSLTKYIGGHGDAVGGALLGSERDLTQIRRGPGVHVGGVMSPFNAWLIIRGAATLPIRMRAHEEGALAVASFLEGHPKVTRVLYPGLPSHPQYELARRQMCNAAGVVSFCVEDGPGTAKRLSRDLRTVHYAVSLGHHRSLIVYLPTADLLTTSFRMDAAQEAAYREYAGDGLFRLSVGLEDAGDIIADLERALG
jgi:methionine-gamma-lyase